MTKLERLARKGDALLDAHQRARLNELNGIERLLFTRLTIELAGLLEETNGRITSRKGYVSIAKAIDAIFEAIASKHIHDMAGNVANDMRSVMDFNARYYRVAGSGSSAFKAFDDIEAKVDGRVRQRLGLDPSGKLLRNGYLDTLFPVDAIAQEVKQMVAKAVSAGIPMRKLTKALSTKITGTDATAGVLEKSIGGAVMGVYRLADSVANNEFGERLALQYGIYSGGLIETSRPFCIEKNGKVFSAEEAKRDWPVDPKLPRTKAERAAYGDNGAPPEYIPLEDMGRWEGTSERCRHRFLWISNEEAYRRRPDLKPK